MIGQRDTVRVDSVSMRVQMSSHGEASCASVCLSGVGLGAKLLAPECGAPKKLNSPTSSARQTSINKRRCQPPVELKTIYLRYSAPLQPQGT